eukprot:Ihof_evm5s385 gene=Ihof_evmTU5s385
MEKLLGLKLLRDKEEILEEEKQAVWEVDDRLKACQETLDEFRSERIGLLDEKEKYAAVAKAITADLSEMQGALDKARGDYDIMRSAIMHGNQAIQQLKDEVDKILVANDMPPTDPWELPAIEHHPLEDGKEWKEKTIYDWVNKTVDAFADEVWNLATVLDVKNKEGVDMVYVHYEGWENEFDEWINISCIREPTGEAEHGPDFTAKGRSITRKEANKNEIITVAPHMQPCQTILANIIKSRHSW